MEKQRIRPSGWFYVLGLAIFLFGCVAAMAFFAFGIAGMVDSAIDIDRLIKDFDRLVVPGSAELVLDESGSYAIFYEYRSVVDGEPFYSSRSRPRLQCHLQVKESGEEVPLINAWPQESNYDLPTRSGTLLMRFDVDRPDIYVLSCDYAGSGDAPEMVLAVGTGFVQTALGLAVSVISGLFVPVLLIFGAGIVGLFVIALVAVLRYQSVKRLSRETS
jgi:hypothetical protein